MSAFTKAASHHVLAWPLLTALFWGCSSAGGGNAGAAGGPGAGGGGSGHGHGDVGGSFSLGGSSACGDRCPSAEQCGDGILTENEACDDGNRESGDGCAATCLTAEPGFSCNPPGAPCQPVAVCGDGVVATNEMCDDANGLDGDGCSARCRLELGYQCIGRPSGCSPTTCGDAKKEGAESCDDGNGIPLDGCSSDCRLEPDCSGAACTSSCGDGLVIEEACDDGNVLSGDGCSAECELEPGFECVQQPSCEMVGGACALRVPAVFRDFTSAHVDFRCGGDPGPPKVGPLLVGGKPVLLQDGTGCVSTAESFSQWYTDHESNRTVPGGILLFSRGDGSYVTRFGSTGEAWRNKDGVALDGNPAFFPIDGAENAFADERLTAGIPPSYTGDGSWRNEGDFISPAPLHNFSFTTEVQYWFRYDEGSSSQLDFAGDDDVWVFINGRLVLDLGGIHVPQTGSVVINATTGAELGLTPGKVYAIKAFHAERRPTGSSFKLTLSGFQATPTDCQPICGDGVVSLGEECDDGVNDGGYGECDSDCQLGPRCGDGVKQAHEDCDDGNVLDGDGCGSACRNIVVQ